MVRLLFHVTGVPGVPIDAVANEILPSALSVLRVIEAAPPLLSFAHFV